LNPVRAMKIAYCTTDRTPDNSSGVGGGWSLKKGLDFRRIVANKRKMRSDIFLKFVFGVR